MVAMMYGPRSIPGPPLRRLAGYRTFLRSFDRDPLAHVETAFQTYGPVSTLVGESARLLFAVGPACNLVLGSHPDAFCAAYPERYGLAPVGTTVRKLADAANVVDASQPIISRWLQLHTEPAFDAWYSEAVVQITQRIVERWGAGQQVDLVYMSRRLTLTALLKTMLGIESEASTETQLVLNHWLERTYRGQTHIPRVARLANRAQQQLVAQIETLHKTQTEEATANIPGELSAIFCRCGQDNHVSSCVAPLVPMVEAAASLITSVLSWTIFLLSQHQRVLDDVRQELHYVLHGEPPTASYLHAVQDRLPLLERVIKETLRLLPPNALGLRHTAQSVELLGYELPPGAALVYSPYLTHRLVNLFVAPQRFRPERWLYIEPTPDEYLPLGLAGESILPLAMLIKHVKLMLATLLQQAQLGLAAGVQVNAFLQPLLMPKTDLPMVVTPMSRSLIHREVHGNIRKLVELTPH